MAKLFLFSICLYALLVSDSQQRASSKEAAKKMGSCAPNTDTVGGLYGKLSKDPIKPLIDVLKNIIHSVLELIFNTYRNLISLVPGTHPNDTKNGIVSETLGECNPLVQPLAAILSRNGLVNVLADQILYLLFGGEKPVNQGTGTLNPNDSIPLLRDLFGNDNSFLDYNGDYFFSGIAGKGTKENENQKLD